MGDWAGRSPPWGTLSASSSTPSSATRRCEQALLTNSLVGSFFVLGFATQFPQISRPTDLWEFGNVGGGWIWGLDLHIWRVWMGGLGRGWEAGNLGRGAV